LLDAAGELSTQVAPTRNGIDRVSETDTVPPQRVGVRELRENMTGFLRMVRQGASFLITSLITSHDRVVAGLRPPPQSQLSPRQPGALRGKIRMAPEFDTLPADVLAAIEGEQT
jgi:antitoxin (DNA-binding transcriptional repressor) of toxin-antitoxin stability system